MLLVNSSDIFDSLEENLKEWNITLRTRLFILETTTSSNNEDILELYSYRKEIFQLHLDSNGKIIKGEKRNLHQDHLKIIVDHQTPFMVIGPIQDSWLRNVTGKDYYVLNEEKIQGKLTVDIHRDIICDMSISF